MVFALEPNQYLYEKLDNISSDIILVYISDLKTEILKNSNFNKKILNLSRLNTYYSHIFSYLNKNFESSTIVANSVVDFIIDFALLLGCNPITFVGQDFALTDKKTHADATYYDGKNKLDKYFYTNQKNILKTYDINNNKIYTTSVLNRLNNSLNNIIEDNKNTIFINASEGGLNKNGAINCKLKDFIDNYCNKENQSDINNIINSALLKSEKILTNEDLPKLKNFFNELIITLEKLLLNSDKAIKTSRELKNLYLFDESPDINEVYNLKNKLKKQMKLYMKNV